MLRGGQYEEEELVTEVKESDIVDVFSTILNSSYATQIVSEYIITSLMKLTTRLSDPGQIDRVRRLLSSNTANLDVEIQQRAVEYGNLFGYDSIRRGVLEKMPPPEIREEQRVLGEATDKRQSKLVNKAKKPGKVTEQDMLLDLMGGSDLPAADLSTTLNGSQNNADLLADILGGGNSVSSPPPQTTSPPPQQRSNVNSIMDLFDGHNTSSNQASTQQPTSASTDLFGRLSSPPPQQQPSQPSASTAHPAYNKNDLTITLQVQRNAGIAQILARFQNTSNFNTLTGVSVQAAVPKSQKLQLNAISSAELDAGQEATQQMRVSGVNGVSPSITLAPCLILLMVADIDNISHHQRN